MSRILIIDDDQQLGLSFAKILSQEGYQPANAFSGREGIDKVKTFGPELVILDIRLPDIGGLEVCRRVRSDSSHKSVPIIMLTAKGEEADIVAGLELGADDYMTKPFSPRVLLARVRAVLRRNAMELPGDEESLHIHELVIHPGRHEVLVAGEAITLTRTEFQVLHYLARRPGWVFTRYQIVDAVHGDDYAVTERSVDVQIVGLRKKLGDAGKYIETVRGVGYRFSS